MDYKEFFQELTQYCSSVYTETFGTDEHILKDYFGKMSKRDIVDVRNICMYIAHKHKKQYLNDISDIKITGYYLKDHAIIYNAEKKCLNLCDSNKLFRHVFEQAEAKFFELVPELETVLTYSDVKKRLRHARISYNKLGKLIDELESELLNLK